MEISLENEYLRYLKLSVKTGSVDDVVAFWIDEEARIICDFESETITLPALRLARNLCTQQNFQSHFFQAKTFPLLLQLIDGYLETSSKLKLRAATQVLANLTVQNAETQDGVWDVCFPERLRKICSLEDSGSVSAGSACILNCILQNPSRIEDLIAEGILFDLILKHVKVEDEKSFHWTFLLTKQACLHGYLPDLISRCPGLPNTLTPEKLAILQVWEKTASESQLVHLKNLEKSIETLVSLLETINTGLVIQKYTSDISEEITVELQMEGCACILESIVQIAAKCTERPDILLFLGETKLIAMMVQLLQMTTQLSGTEGTQAAVELDDLEGHYTGRNECILDDGSGEKFSFKKSLVKILANLCYECKPNQDKVRECGGIELILNCCRVDENHPYLKEWALFATRNLTKDNPENIAYIEEFSKQGETRRVDPLLAGRKINITRTDDMM